VNDWCADASGTRLDAEKTDAFIAAYQGLRPFTENENRQWKPCLAVAASRFWLSRLKALALHSRGEAQVVKDPEQYRALLCSHLGSDS
jgi:homoserine kinase type II